MNKEQSIYAYWDEDQKAVYNTSSEEIIRSFDLMMMRLKRNPERFRNIRLLEEVTEVNPSLWEDTISKWGHPPLCGDTLRVIRRVTFDEYFVYEFSKWWGSCTLEIVTVPDQKGKG